MVSLTCNGQPAEFRSYYSAEECLHKATDLITYLAQQGIKDIVNGNGKSAAELARSFGMEELAQHITASVKEERK